MSIKLAKISNESCLNGASIKVLGVSRVTLASGRYFNVQALFDFKSKNGKVLLKSGQMLELHGTEITYNDEMVNLINRIRNDICYNLSVEDIISKYIHHSSNESIFLAYNAAMILLS